MGRITYLNLLIQSERGSTWIKSTHTIFGTLIMRKAHGLVLTRKLCLEKAVLDSGYREVRHYQKSKAGEEENH
jgi:hypothetical protein